MGGPGGPQRAGDADPDPRLSFQADRSLPPSCFTLLTEGREPEILCARQRPGDTGGGPLESTAPSALGIVGVREELGREPLGRGPRRCHILSQPPSPSRPRTGSLNAAASSCSEPSLSPGGNKARPALQGGCPSAKRRTRFSFSQGPRGAGAVLGSGRPRKPLCTRATVLGGEGASFVREELTGDSMLVPGGQHSDSTFAYLVTWPPQFSPGPRRVILILLPVFPT